MRPAQRINQDSGNTEWYTPRKIIVAAREVMGGIDLDPASSDIANEIVLARRFYSINDNGLARPWFGRVWMNHPFGRNSNKLWISKLVEQYESGNISVACCITYASTSEQWFQPLLQYPQCFLTPRTNYYSPNGKRKNDVTKGSVVTYLGKAQHKFKQIFQHKYNLGVVK